MNKPLEGEVLEREIDATQIDAGTLAVINRAEIDVQIATAHRFPRSVTKFRAEAEELVTLTEEVADECIYALERRDSDGSVKTIEGPSSRFAEIIMSSWGNCRAGARVVDDQGEFVTAQGVFHDLQKNVFIAYEVRRRIVNKRGQRFSTDMIGVTANAACSIAIRNAVLKGVPKALWSSIYETAKRTMIGDYKTLSSRRDQTLETFKKIGVSAERVFEKMGVKGSDDLTIDHILRLKTMLNAVKEGDTTPEELFPVAAPGAGERSGAASLKAAVASGTGEKKEGAASTSTTSTTSTAGAKPAAAPGGKHAGTPAIKAKYLKFFAEAKTVDALNDFKLETDLYAWEPADLSEFDKAYRARSEEIKK